MTAADAMLGNYRLQRVLGQGASATVHLAQDQRSGLWVALKVLSGASAAGGQPAELRSRFLQEAQIARRLRHPDIVAIHAAGETAGSLWLAMELVPGHSLERYVQPRLLLPPALAIGICIRVARALAHAHALGVVHRDIKPSNVLVDLATDSVKLTDFGTARLLDGCPTKTGLMLGTPAYTAPELLAGAVGDAASDLYSLGVVLFELLAGRRPHESASMGELLRQVAIDSPPDLRELRPELPAPLAEVVARLLVKRPHDRPAGAEAAASALAAVLAQWPDAQRP
ncbi:serine/threonine-protein kinase [Brevundimonas sp.]|uniref:serine/threonine-protein kinase n=1 Tax=Brevundimonas sp. TaxID=1871086 RepID=UPI00272EF9B2|nr:serine/threonine-protein kinase [Brevundimonas sp.]MDP1912170.1 serine/threonine-protein kinase [Brevundimonas sp.]